MGNIDEDALMVLDMYLGDIVTGVVRRHGYPVVLEEEYYDILMYIYEELVKTWFGGREPGIRELRERLKKARKEKAQLEVLVSYLVSKYLEQSGTLYITR